MQIGITLVGILGGTFSGATLGARLATSLIDAGMPSAFAQPVGVGSVVVAITHLSLIAGVMRIADRTARGLMTARHEVETLDASSDKRNSCSTFMISANHDCRSGRGTSTTSSVC